MNKQKWIALTAAGTMSLGLVASGAIAAANATELQDSNGDQIAAAQGGTVQQSEVHESKRFSVGPHTNMKLVSVVSANSPASVKSAVSVNNSLSVPSAPSAPAPQQPTYTQPQQPTQPTYTEPTYTQPQQPTQPPADSANSGWSAPSADSAPSAGSND